MKESFPFLFYAVLSYCCVYVFGLCRITSTYRTKSGLLGKRKSSGEAPPLAVKHEKRFWTHETTAERLSNGAAQGFSAEYLDGAKPHAKVIDNRPFTEIM